MRKPASILALALIAASCSVQDGTHSLYVVTTGDVHGAFFDEPYVEGAPVRTSLMSVKHYLDSLRATVGQENVLLIDDGDVLQGDNAAYYYDYVAVDEPHIYPQLAAYMGYDACVLGNHDIETGHAVYDRVYRDMKKLGIPWLAGNALKPDGRPYFPVYTCVRKAGLKVAVLGFDNANIRAWLSEELWQGMTFESLIPLVQDQVDRVVAKERPQVVVVAVHSGTGDGDNAKLESQGLDLFRSLEGVDVLVTAHDHRPYCEQRGNVCMINGGAKAAAVGYAEVTVETNGGKVLSKNSVGSVVIMNKTLVDDSMKQKFRPQFEAVSAFTNQVVGRLAMPLRTRDAYMGMCDYVNLVHTVQMSVPEAELSLAAPLTFDGFVDEGEIIFNDMFTIYPFENQLFVSTLSGRELLAYLEYSYDLWIQTAGEHVLRISPKGDARTGSSRWSFENRAYNFDSCAGLIYEVDVTRCYGERVKVISMADGSPFNPDRLYNVAMTSYRANGGGDMLQKGAGIPLDELDSRVVARYPEIRDLIYRFFSVQDSAVSSESVGNRALIGSWKFVPEDEAQQKIKADMALIF